MALREFKDRNGILWRVWAVTPEFMHPATAAEDYLGDYQEGWLTFECQESRRRLPRIPRDWDALPDAQLEQMLDRAEHAAPRRRPGSFTTGPQPLLSPRPTAAGSTSAPRSVPPPASPQPPQPAALSERTPTGRRRIFSDPSGHVVIAGVERPAAPSRSSGGEPDCDPPSPAGVLRFRSDDKQVHDLADWPADWERLPKPELVELYARARRESERESAQRAAESAARTSGAPAATPRRRATDRKE